MRGLPSKSLRTRSTPPDRVADGPRAGWPYEATGTTRPGVPGPTRASPTRRRPRGLGQNLTVSEVSRLAMTTLLPSGVLSGWTVIVGCASRSVAHSRMVAVSRPASSSPAGP